jgi:septation ring formation regulator EzrA
VSALPPTTSIATVFAQVDSIAAQLQILTARSPTYSQFNTTLQQLSRQITGVHDQLTQFDGHIQSILLLLQAIVASMATLTNQVQILAQLQTIQRTLQNVPGIPTQIGIDLKDVETVEQEAPEKSGP